jgi:hypothetical protein
LFCLFALSGTLFQNGDICGNNPWNEKDIISIEIDSNNKTLHFFINNILQPVSLWNIPFPLKGEVCLFLFFVYCIYSFGWMRKERA